ncbi:hypothetical protein BKA69DRAFT_1046432 [Paraphysoderma sedebokerense]|nr:hypothetical protein BKA69DRAFT_1046432 [Paraphysoderma sedebokerense]
MGQFEELKHQKEMLSQRFEEVENQLQEVKQLLETANGDVVSYRDNSCPRSWI